MTDYTPIDPKHYRDTPSGIDLECIEYTELLFFSQGTAAKYIYRAGNKDPLEQDLKKALWYIKRARSRRIILDIDDIDESKAVTVHPSESLRALLFLFTIRGHLDLVQTMIEELLKDGGTLD